MPTDLVLSLLVLAGTILLIATGALRTDLVALAALVLVTVLGLVPASVALASFANPAVVTIAGMFVISAGLSRTGVAELLGRWLIRVAGARETRLTLAVMLVSGLLSGVVNNIGVGAMMLPVVVTVARRTGVSPSRLLIPTALGAQLGGFITLLGTSTNLLASDALREAGYESFGLLTYTPIGLVLLAAGAVIVAVLGPRVLPDRDPVARPGGGIRRAGIRGDIDLAEHLFTLTVPSRSLLAGKTLAASRLGSAVGVHVLAIRRGVQVFRAPGPEFVLAEGDRIIVQGRPEYFDELRGHRHLRSDGGRAIARLSASPDATLATVQLAEESEWVGSSPADLGLRRRSGMLVLAIRRDDGVVTRAGGLRLRADDELLIQGPPEEFDRLLEGAGVARMDRVDAETAIERFGLARRLWALRVTRDSLLAGRALEQTRLGDAAGLMVLAVEREGEDGQTTSHLFPGPEFVLEGGDHLLVKAEGRDLAALRGLQRLIVDTGTPVDPDVLEGADAGFSEVVVAPRSALIGKTLRLTHFRERYGVHVVAVVREGGTVTGDLGDEKIRFGDALLLYGSRRHQRALAEHPDLIPLHSARVEAPDFRLAPRSLIVAAVALSAVIVGWVPVSVGVLGGSVMMVLTHCLTPDEAYRAVSLPSLALVAGMLALGAALAGAGAMDLLGSFLYSAFGDYGPHVLLGALVGVAALGGQILPAPALVVVMAPIAISTAQTLAVSPHPFVMAVGIAATSVASPVSQPINALMMSPAGYRTSDFLRLGVPITLMVLLVSIFLVPVFLPF